MIFGLDSFAEGVDLKGDNLTHVIIGVTSQLLKKRFRYKLFAINLYFNSSQYYPTLDKTLAIQLSLHLICFILRLYPCNINPHLINH